MLVNKCHSDLCISSFFPEPEQCQCWNLCTIQLCSLFKILIHPNTCFLNEMRQFLGMGQFKNDEHFFPNLLSLGILAFIGYII